MGEDRAALRAGSWAGGLQPAQVGAGGSAELDPCPRPCERGPKPAAPGGDRPVCSRAGRRLPRGGAGISARGPVPPCGRG